MIAYCYEFKLLMKGNGQIFSLASASATLNKINYWDVYADTSWFMIRLGPLPRHKWWGKG